MALKNDKINPLNALDIRKVTFPAVHFHYILLDKCSTNLLRNLDDWIYNNLNGRYYIGQDLILDKNNTFTYVPKIGFEIEKEISFFKIACPYI